MRGEAGIVNNLDVHGASTIEEVIHFIETGEGIPKEVVDTREEFQRKLDEFDVDFEDVKGQESTKKSNRNSSCGWT